MRCFSYSQYRFLTLGMCQKNSLVTSTQRLKHDFAVSRVNTVICKSKIKG